MNKDNLIKVRKYQLQNSTPFELLFKRKLKKWNIKFIQQKLISGYLADFFLPQYGLVVEIDGAAHYTYGSKRDKRRDDAIRQNGFQVLRIRNSEVFDYQKEDVLQAVNNFAQKPPSRSNFFQSYLQSLQ